MGLLEDIKEDLVDITSDSDGFGVELVFTNPAGDATATINGLHTKHHISLDETGRPVNSKNAHISFVESLLIAEDYTIRSASGEVNLKGHKVSVVDSTGDVKHYMIREWFPDEKLGLIVCILGDFE
jgi:hypothetical protein